MLDELQGKLTVNWRWVDGHKDTEGNIQADDLAKKGVSEENCFWQEKAYSWYASSSGEDIQVEFVDKIYSVACLQISSNSDVKEKNHREYICKSCNIPCKENEQAIQCQECKYWVHYKCSDLPEYQLYLYESTQRRYTCKFCVSIDNYFLKTYQINKTLILMR